MKRTLIISGFVLIVALAAFAQSSVKTDPDISSIIGNIDPANIQNTDLALQNFRTRHACSDQPEPGHGVTAAREYIFNQYSAIPGLEVRRDPFVHASCPNAPTYNVIAWLPGRGDPSRLVIIGGHYDSRTIDVNDATSDAPGGNDSGGQTSVVLEMARVLAGQKYHATIVFISFSGEEQGLFGSGSIAANLSRYFKNPKVIAMLNTDIPGGDNIANTASDLQKFRLYSPGIPRERASAAPDGTTDNTSPSRGVMRYVGTWGAAYVPSMTMLPKLREDRPGRGSDHSSFINNGYPAVRIMETFECSPSPVDNSCSGPFPCPPPDNVPASCKDFTTSHQHAPGDRNEFITPSYAARIAQLMAATAASLARAPDAPQNFAATGNATQGVRVSFTPPNNFDQSDDTFVVAARPATENFYHQRVTVAKKGSAILTPQALGLNPGDSFFISVATVDGKGHESLFAYPEVRCDSAGCAVPVNH
jgi:Zn-dependent M28 family amino/carboxypeptidase